MQRNDAIQAIVDARRSEIKALDDELIGEVVGVSQAMDELHKALKELDACLDRRDFDGASALGYDSVSKNFVFLQRTLGALQSLCADKQRIVQSILVEAGDNRCAYEDVEPYVDALMTSAQPRKR